MNKADNEMTKKADSNPTKKAGSNTVTGNSNRLEIKLGQLSNHIWPGI